MISERVRKLRKQSLDAKPFISTNRAELVTEVYKSNFEKMSEPIKRALVFKHLMENKPIYIGDGELIVGEKGPVPKATPTYPELCCHSLHDLKILNNRKKIPFAVSEDSRKIYEEKIIPFWHDKSMRDFIFSEMTLEWKDSYEAGIFTEFMEQRAPGHTVLDDKIYKKGFLDFKNDIQKSLEKLDYSNDPKSHNKEQELKAMSICSNALITFALRHSEEALSLSKKEIDPARKSELEKIAKVCKRVPANSPQNFWEAIQYYWFVHLGVTTELNTWDAFCPGHIDHHLYPFYKKEIEEGSLTKEKAEELLQCFWIKFNNQPAPPKVGVTAEESGTYTDFAQINLGGHLEDGSDGVNELTYLLLDVIEKMRLIQPSSSIQVSKKNPNEFVKHAAEIIKTGFGQPSVFNSDLIIEELVRQGKTLIDARCGGSSGCVEVGAFGKENYNLTGYFNLPKVLEITLNDGIDPRTGKQVGIKTGEAESFNSFDELYYAFDRQLNHFINVKIKGNSVIEQLYAEKMPAPFLSLLIDDCIANGKDYHSGGARYNTSYIQGVGLGTITDSLSAIKYHVFENNNLQMKQIMQILKENFEGNERTRQLLLNKTPRYGNDNDFADDIMKQVFESYFNAIDGRKNFRGGTYHINLLPTTVHVYFGSVIGATPDGRFAFQPLSEGVSPAQGADRHGPTAVLKSVSKMDHCRTGGTLLNQKLTPQLLEKENGINKFVALIRTYFKLGGHHIQFNVVDKETLLEAKAHPELYRNLIVRVAGYSDYFCDLSEALQDEIITRTEHQDY